MTPAEQLQSLGVSVEAEDGHLIVQMERSFMMLTVEEVTQFDHFLHVAAHEAAAQNRKRLAVIT